MSYELDFIATVRWKAINETSTALDVTVREKSGNARVRDCEEECFHLIRGILQKEHLSLNRRH